MWDAVRSWTESQECSSVRHDRMRSLHTGFPHKGISSLDVGTDAGVDDPGYHYPSLVKVRTRT